MENETILTVNAQTGEAVERELTAQEVADLEASQSEWVAQEFAAKAKATARESALAKLAELGLTAEEIAAL